MQPNHNISTHFKLMMLIVSDAHILQYNTHTKTHMNNTCSKVYLTYNPSNNDCNKADHKSCIILSWSYKAALHSAYYYLFVYKHK